jgi:hypothetical protein
VLTAAQVNTYLMDQAVMRFADEAARTTAFGGVGEPTLAEGMMSYLIDTQASKCITVLHGSRSVVAQMCLQVQVFLRKV